MKDQVKFGSAIDANTCQATRRQANGEVQVGTMSELQDGHPIPEGAELIQVNYRPSNEWHDAETIYKHGPSQVATPAYREGYDRIFGKKEVGIS